MKKNEEQEIEELRQKLIKKLQTANVLVDFERLDDGSIVLEMSLSDSDYAIRFVEEVS